MSKKKNYLGSFAEIMDEDRVFSDKKRLKSYLKNAKSETSGLKAVVQPQSSEEVKQIVDLARDKQLNLVAVSSSNAAIEIRPTNAGKAKKKSDTIIVDMSKMNKIGLVDRRNRAALIEAGVTYSELISEAQKHGLKVHLPLLPSAKKSVLASYLESEPIQIPKYHWDMTDPLLASELVFGTGEVFRTGSAAGPGTLEQQRSMGFAQVNPLGPGQCDLIRLVQGSQGTMGLATWSTVKLEVNPSIHLIRFIPGDTLDSLVDFAYKVLRRKLCDEFFILNGQSLANVIAASGHDLDGLAQQQAPYTLVLGISGYEYFPEERVSYQEADLAKLAKEAGVEIVDEVPGCSGEEMGWILSAPYEGDSYKACVKDGFREIFFLTTLNKAQSFIDLMEKETKKQKMSMTDIGVYIQPIQQGRTAHVEFTIYYDSKKEGEKQRADQLFSNASRTLIDKGAYFSRPYGEWSDLAYAKCEDTVHVLKEVKNILDPKNVLNQGKLCFKEVR